MSNYSVQLVAPRGHRIPKLLADLGAFVGNVEHGSLGRFDGLTAQAVPEEWSEEHAERLQKGSFVFLELPEGSLLALLKVGRKAPVVLLGSEGAITTIAESLAEFLHKWAAGETGIDELDDDDAVRRSDLGVWLEERKVRKPRAKQAFDFQAWLDTGDGYAKATPVGSSGIAPSRAPTEAMNDLGPKLREVANLVGLRLDDPTVTEYITTTLKKKPPTGTSERDDSTWLEVPRVGLNLLFSHEVRHDDYPPVPKTAKSFVPYLCRVDVSDKLKEPFWGLSWTSTLEDITKGLGEPTEYRARLMTGDEFTIPTWIRCLDDAASVDLTIEFRKQMRVTIAVRVARELERYRNTIMGLFLAWGIARGLVDESRFSQWAVLINDIKERKRQGTEIIAAALPRGLWDDHLVDRPGLRLTAYRWFHNMNGLWVVRDLKEVLGARMGPHGHEEPILDDDTWELVEKASARLDEVFKEWLN